MNEKLHQLEGELHHLKIVSQFSMDILLANSELEIYGLVTNTLLNKLNIDNLELYSFDPLSKILTQTQAYANKQAISLELVDIRNMSVGEGLIGKAAKICQGQIIETFRDYPPCEQPNSEILSSLIVPILADEKLAAIIYMTSKSEFDSNIQHSLAKIASITALKLQKNRVTEQLHQTIEKLDYSGKIQNTLFEIAELIFETANMQEFYERMHKSIAKLMFASNFFVGLVTDEGQAIALPYIVDEIDDIPPNELIQLDNKKPSITGYVLNTNTPLLVNKQKLQSMIDSNQVYIKGTLPNAWLGVPFGEAPLRGVVVIQSYNENISFTDKDQQLLCFVAKHIRNAIERMQARADLQFLALHDPLTKLSNRSLFNDRVNHALNKSLRDNSKKMALLFLDLDKFKQVNDTYGHHIGDLLLVKVSKLLKKSIRKTDTLSRLGGDEFAILLEDIISVDSAVNVANKIIRALQNPFMLEEFQINTSTSIGIAFHDRPENTLESLIICADEAMYEAKQQGRNKAVLHQFDDKTVGVDSKSIDLNTIDGLENNQFFFVFQPIVNLHSGDLVGVEALVRWKNPQTGTLQPQAFLNQMVEAKSIVQLDVYNVNRAINHLKKWVKVLPSTFRLSINISAQGFASTALLEAIQIQFEKEPDIFQYLSLETTEKSIVETVELTRAQMNIFSLMGIHLALDDYGTGYSSLSYLGQFKFNQIKIDRSLVIGQDKNSEPSIVLETINSLAKSLALKTIAKGIETKGQLELMQSLQCTMGQGFYISKPLFEDELMDLLKNKNSLINS